MKKSDCNYPTFAVSLERLAAANVSVELHEVTGLLVFTDRSETMFPLFDNEAVNNLVNQFGEHRTDSMLDEAAHVVRREMMAERIRQAMRD